MYLQGMANDPTYTTAAQQLMHDIQQIPEHMPLLPTRYCTPALTLTLLAHPSAIHATRRTTAASLNVTHATPASAYRNTDTNSRRGPPPDRDRSRSRERQQPSSMNRSRQSSSSTPRSTGRVPLPRNYDIQCDACNTNGHNHTGDCRLFPKVAAILDYITHHPSESKAALYQYKKAQHPDTRRAARDKIIKVLKGSTIQYDNLADEDAHIEALADQLTGDYWTDTDDHAATICRLQTMQPTDHKESASCTVISTSTPSNTIRQSANCVRLPDHHMMQVPRTPYPTVTKSRTLFITQGHSRMDNRRDLADTGASVCATGMLDILHDFTEDTMYTIVGYDGASTQAAGQGTAHIVHSDTGHIEHMFFVYVPSIRGTIVSLEHHARTHP